MSPFLYSARLRRSWSILVTSIAPVLISLLLLSSSAQVTAAQVSSTGSEGAVAAKMPPHVPSADFYVATDGNDSWSGTLPAPNNQHTDGPFASVARAQIAVQKLLQSHPKKTIRTMIRQGSYYLPLSPTNPGTLHFSSADSGTPQTPVTWENYPGETPTVSGGEALGAGGLQLSWTNSSGNLWQVQLPKNTQPFEYLFYQPSTSGRRFRSRLQSASGTGYYMNNGSCYSTVTGQTVAIGECNLATFLRIAASVPPGNTGCPTVRSGNQSKCLDRFKYNPDDPITNWTNLNGIYTGDPSKPCRADSSNPYPVGDIELTLFNAWTVDVMRINCVDTNNHIIYLTGPTQGAAGEYNYFGPSAGHRYIIENTKDAFNREEQDGQTGIWFLDRSSLPWTLSYIANSGENPNTDNVVIPQLQPATAIGGSIVSAKGLDYVTFHGITFEVDDFIPPSYGFNDDDNGENMLPAAVDCENCQHVTFDGISVRHTSASGLQIASLDSHSGPSASNDLIQNSAFYDLGSSGIHIGHAPSGSDVTSSVVHSVTVQNNIVQGYSRIFADGEGLAQGDGNNIVYLHNDIDDGYHAGISICQSGCPGDNGNNIVAQYNRIWNMMQGITSDGGALYYDIGNLTKSGTGNQVLNNLIHDVTDASIIDQKILGTGYGGHGVYLDAQTAGMNVENNVIYRVSSDTTMMAQGPADGQPPNTFKNNILAYGRKGMFAEGNAWPQNCTNTLRVNLVSNIMYFDQTDATSFYVVQGCADSCGMSFNDYQNFQRNLYWRTDGKFATYDKAFHVLPDPPPPDQANSCTEPPQPGQDWSFFDFPVWQNGHPLVKGKPIAMDEDAEGTVTVNPGFGHSGSATDFLLSKSPVTGFDFAETNSTIKTAGRINPWIHPPAVPPTFPTYYYTTF
ncbi:MAG TPA: right-handed parallel beta-helix repeat-containing protein [Terriglobales bacterium]|nr:right-handed parallel beta-helix repeat-containing protein [Terriglobales bacterium]